LKRLKNAVGKWHGSIGRKKPLAPVPTQTPPFSSVKETGMAQFENIYDGRGKKIVEIHQDSDRDNYYDPNGRFLGRTDENATRDKIGRKIADKPIGGLLIPKK
jgi:hypothetical protein